MSWRMRSGGNDADDYHDYDDYDDNLSDEVYDDDYGDDYDVEYDFERRHIISELHASYLRDLDLTNDLWRSSVTMESLQLDVENLIVALQSNRSLETISISRDILAAIGESDQGRIFCSVGKLPTLRQMSVDGETESSNAIHTRVLVDALSETSNGIKVLELSGLKISSRSEVEQLARGLKARVGSLESVTLEGILLDLEDKTGILDPILLALAPVPGDPRGKLSCFRLSCVESALNRASVVSPEALETLFAEEPIEGPRSKRTFRLRNLGLNCNHCEVIAQELGRGDALLRPIEELDLTGNPSIGQQGYAALLGLLNRRFNIGGVRADDQNWKSTFALVIFMNLEGQRGRFMENGVFPSKAMWVNFLAGLSTDRYCYSTEAKQLNAIWYTLRENPDLICT
jgi:hypothetical protein